MTYERCDAPHELKQDDIDGLHGAVMETLNRHFGDFDQAAGAFETYRRVRAAINADTTLPMFGVLEAFEAALAAHPDAKEWAAKARRRRRSRPSASRSSLRGKDFQPSEESDHGEQT